jgi:hypothetical protein
LRLRKLDEVLQSSYGEGRYVRHGIEVAVAMQDRERVPQRASGDQTVDARADGETDSPSGSVEIDGLLVHLGVEG